MKDSFGGTIMIYIFIFFLGLYIVFISLTLQYAQSFRVKNKLIDIIEEYDGISVTNKTLIENNIEDYLKKVSVTPDKIDIKVIPIEEINVSEKCYYKASSLITWTWPFLGVKGTWEIKGETKNVKNCEPDINIDL